MWRVLLCHVWHWSWLHHDPSVSISLAYYLILYLVFETGVCCIAGSPILFHPSANVSLDLKRLVTVHQFQMFISLVCF